MTKSFPKIMKHINWQIQESQDILIKINKTKFVPKHTVVKQKNIKDFTRQKSDYMKCNKWIDIKILGMQSKENPCELLVGI